MLSFTVAGPSDGPLVILVHGVEDCAVAWADYIDHLSGRYLVVAIDALGHGLSPRFTDDELADPFASAYAALERTVEHIEALFGRTAILVGHSMGGAQATLLACRRPDLVRGVVAEDPAWLNEAQRLGYRERAEANAELLDGWRADPAAAIDGNRRQRPLWPLDDHLGWALGKLRCDRRLILTGVVSFAEPWQDVVRAVGVPLVVVSSDRAGVLVGRDGLREAAALGNPNVTTVFIAGAEHALRRTAADRFNEAIDPYLAEWSV